MQRSLGLMITLGALVILGAFPPLGVVAEQDLPGISGPEIPKPGSGVVDLLAPIRRNLSGASWLIAEGADTRQWQDRPGWSTMTRMDWGDHGSGIVGPVGAPLAQSGLSGLVPFRDPAPAFSRDILITRDFGSAPFQTEPHLAVNPKDPDHLLMGAIDYNFPNNSAYVSLDGGATWQGPQQLRFLRDDDISAGDPVVGFDRNGKAYFISISLGTEEYVVGPLVAFAEISSIAIANSDDGGFTWNEPVSTARSSVSSEMTVDSDGLVRGSLIFSFLDKPWMSIGPDPQDLDRDLIVVSYTEFSIAYDIRYVGELPFLGLPVVETTIRAVRSIDGGRTWSQPVGVSPTVVTLYGGAPGPQGTAGQKRTVQGSQPKFAPDGTLYVTWLDTTDDDSMTGLAEIYVVRSKDGGQTFSLPERVVVFNEVAFRPRNAFFRFWASSFPQIAVGGDGDVYIAYASQVMDPSHDDGNIYIVKSLDYGQTWSLPTRLNRDETDRLQFFPAITVGPDGVIHAMWGDMRDDPKEIRYHIYYTRSGDKGETWGFENKELGVATPDTRVTDFPSNSLKGFPSGLFLGDYFSIVASEKDVSMVWADTRLGEFGAENQKIGFTRQRAVPSPEVFLSPPSGPGGRDVSIQGFGFQPETDVFVQVGGVIVSAERTNDQGRFTTNLFMPVTGEGAHAVIVFDESGNRANASFYTEFGFDTMQDVQQELIGQVDSLRREMRVLLGEEQLSDGAADLTVSKTGESNLEVSELSTPRWIFLLFGLLVGTALGGLLVFGIILLWLRRRSG